MSIRWRPTVLAKGQRTVPSTELPLPVNQRLNAIKGRRRLSHRCRLESLEPRHLLAAELSATTALIDYSSFEVGESDQAVVSRLITPQTAANSTASQYPSVGLVGDTRGSFCTGTLIASEYVLTAAHCAEGVAPTAGRFIVGGQTYATSQVFVHPNYNESALGGDNANDIAIYKLNRSVTNVTPSPIFRGTPTVGQTMTLVGFGGARSATGGSDGSFGTKRVGTTPIDRVSRTIIGWTYDNLSESNTAPGDSGGPSYLTVGGVNYVAGVTSGGTLADAGLGDNSFNTRVDAYQSWIDSIVGSTTPTTPTNPTLPVVSIVASDASAGETNAGQTANTATFTITRTGATTNALTVALSRAGTATAGSDYASFSTTVTIPAGSASTTVRVTPTNDTVVESTETVTLAIVSGTLYQSSTSAASATVSIVDNDVAISTSNDRFANRQRLNGTSTTVTGNNALATRETGEPNPAGVSGGKSVWYTWTATASGSVTLTTAGSSFDTTLGVYTGTALSSLRQVAANDDENYSAGRLTSRVTFNATAGTTYQILVDGYAGASGNVSLSLSQSRSSITSQSSRVSGVATSAAQASAAQAFAAAWAVAQSSHPSSLRLASWSAPDNAVRDAIFAALRRFS